MVPQTGGLTQRKFIFSQFWMLEVQNLDVSSVGFFWDLSPWLIDGCLLPRVHMVCLLCVSVSCKNMSHTGIEPTQWPHFNFIISYWLYLQIHSHKEVLEVKTSLYEFWKTGTQFLTHSYVFWEGNSSTGRTQYMKCCGSYSRELNVSVFPLSIMKCEQVGNPTQRYFFLFRKTVS